MNSEKMQMKPEVVPCKKNKPPVWARVKKSLHKLLTVFRMHKPQSEDLPIGKDSRSETNAKENPEMCAMRKKNRVMLGLRVEQEGWVWKGNPYRSSVGENGDGIEDKYELLAAFASLMCPASEERIKKLGKMLENGNEDEQKDAAQSLAFIISDPEIYGEAASKRARQELVNVSHKGEESVEIQEEWIDENRPSQMSVEWLGSQCYSSEEYPTKMVSVTRVIGGNQHAKDALVSLGLRDD